MPYCPKCGSRVDGSSVFCTECGFKLSGGSSDGIASESQIITAVTNACDSVCGYGMGSLSSDINVRTSCEVYISGSDINVHVKFSVQHYCSLMKAKKLASAEISSIIPTIRRKIDMALSSMTLPKSYNVRITQEEPWFY